MDRCQIDKWKIMLLSHTLTMRGSHVANGWIPPCGLGDSVTDARKTYVVLAHPYHEGKSCSKFGWIMPSSLEGDSVSDRWTDDGRTGKNNVVLAHPYHEGKWCSKFSWIPLSDLGGDSMTDRWTYDGCTNGWSVGWTDGRGINNNSHRLWG